METTTANDLDQVSTDHLETELMGSEALISQVRARQCRLLSELDRRQVATADGARNLVDWLAARLDVTHATARTLVRTTRRLETLPHITETLTRGEVSFDRAATLASFATPDTEQRLLDESHRWDITGLQRIAARHRRITRTDEHTVARDHFLVMQPDLFDLTWKLWGQLTASDGTIVDKALQQRGDQLGTLPNGEREPRNARMATGLVSVCQDTLNGSLPEDDTPRTGSNTDVTIFIDGHLAAETSGEAGAEIASGPRIGPLTLQELLCTGKIGILGHLPDGTLIRVGDHTQTIPPNLRRYIYYRDSGICSVDGCTSRYRLQPHHRQPRAQGGDNHPHNLALICWYHHHRIIHQLGYRIDPQSQTGRIQLIPPQRDPP